MKLTKILCCSLLPVSLSVFGMAGNTDVSRFNGVYVGVNAGPTFMPKIKETDSTGDYIEKKMKTGYLGGLAMGLKNDYFRAELEAGYTKSDIDEVTYHGLVLNGVGGDVKAYSILANFYYDLDYFHSNFMPYIGIGLGSVHVDEDTETENGYKLDGNFGAFAGQGIAGLKYYFNRTLSVSLDYRYFISEKKSFNIKDNLGQEGTMEERYKNQMVLLGLDYCFE